MKNTSLLAGGLAVIAAAMAAFAIQSPAQADLYVIESTAAAIKVGARLTDADNLSVPAGSQIRAVLPSGKTQTIKGPYEGKVVDLTKGQPMNEGVMVWIRNILDTGGSRESTPGATRSVKRDAKPADFSWSAVPVTTDGNICVDKNATLQLVRAASTRTERVMVVDAASAAQAEAQWETGNTIADWPSGLAPRADATYYLLVQDRPRRQVTLRVIEQLPADDDILAELQTRGCKYQFDSYLRGKIIAGRSPS
jgi:hypothetical protein